MRHAHRITALALGLAVLLAGCAPRVLPPPRLPTAPDVDIAPPPAPATEGSLWTVASAGGLVSDVKARTVGDLLTVQIVESSTGQNNASTELDKSSAYSLALPKLFGLEEELRGQLTDNFDPDDAYRISGQKSFEGDGTTARSNSLLATVTVRVVAAGQGGRMAIAGSKEVRVNHERQVLMLTGIVRPEDVQPDNTILSTAISDLRIEFGGIGEINDNNRQGWFSRFMDKLWPF